MDKQHFIAVAGQGGSSFNYFIYSYIYIQFSPVGLSLRGQKIHQRGHKMINGAEKKKKQSS